ncbi:pre-tRNA nuclear export protein [Lobaria immixta]|nr:pre-tRNA nuclear export protein [Lobaria immixta]
MVYIQNVYGVGDGAGNLTPDSVNIQNKIAQTATYLFVFLYATEWTSFFSDMLSLTAAAGTTVRDNLRGAAFYLRVLNAVHDEIADILVPKLEHERTRDNELKDLVRRRDAKTIALSWQEILFEWRGKNSSLVAQCLAAVRRWVAWTDISLFINDPFLNILFELITPPQSTAQDDTTFVATETFTEILGKKMSAGDKLELIDVLKVRDVVSQLIESKGLRELRATPNYDTDLAEAVAKLVNNAMYDIIKALESVQDGEPTSIRGNAQLNTYLPYVLRFFSDEYDEICSTVIPCMTDLLALFRKKAKMNSTFCSENAGMLPPILNAVIAKMKYDDTSAWGNEDSQTDEAEFQELRKRLGVLQQAVASVNENLCLDTISNLVIEAFGKFQSQQGHIDWRDLDLAMHEMFLFGELSLKNGGQYSKGKPASPAAERLIGMMVKLVGSEIASFSHPAIQLQYMEICVRYYTFFEANPQLIAPVLEKFVQLVHHDHIRVQSRSWYLFHRFVKHVRQHIGDIAQTVIQALGGLLQIKAELPEITSDNGEFSSDENDQNASSKFTRQLYLYEAIGSICSAHTVPVNNQVLYVRSIITPLYSDLEAHLGPAKIGDERATLQVHHLIMAFGTLARGFSDWTPGSTASSTPPAKIVSDEFMKGAEATLVALETLSSAFDVRTAARFALSRFIAVLGNHLLPQLPRWIDGLLSQTSSKEEMALFLRLLDQIVFGFKSEIFDVLNTLLTPFLQRVFLGIGEAAAGTDDEIQLAELKREYLNFLLVILNNNLERVLVSETNQLAFEAVINMIEHLAKDVTDFAAAKLALFILTRMVETWGGPDVQSPSTSHGNNITNITPQPTLPGFDRFMMTRFSPLCWALPTNLDFPSKDAQAKIVLGEAAGLQKAIYLKTGQEYVTWLRNVELRDMGMDAGIMEEYLRALCNFDLKGFRQFFQALVQKSINARKV